MNHGSLFSGIGGFDLAAELMEWENIFHCEYADFPSKILKFYWPNATSFKDITTTDFSVFRGKVFILTGGFPCQPFSQAGKRNGINDGRYLWPEMLRAIREIQPTFVVGENVTGILSMAEREVFARVDSSSYYRFEDYDYHKGVYTRQEKMLVTSIIQDLEKEGYKVQVFAIPAAGVGAPHKRERIWFVAENSNQDGCRGIKGKEQSKKRKQRNTGTGDNEPIRANNDETGNDANTNTSRFERWTIEGKFVWIKRKKVRDDSSGFCENKSPSHTTNSGLEEQNHSGGEKKSQENRSEENDRPKRFGLDETTSNAANSGVKRVQNGRTYPLNLGLIPTPLVSDCGTKVTGLENQDSLVKMSRQITGQTSQLNPRFVAEMMGFPVNWTELPFQNGEKNQ